MSYGPKPANVVALPKQTPSTKVALLQFCQSKAMAKP